MSRFRLENYFPKSSHVFCTLWLLQSHGCSLNFLDWFLNGVLVLTPEFSLLSVSLDRVIWKEKKMQPLNFQKALTKVFFSAHWTAFAIFSFTPALTEPVFL